MKLDNGRRCFAVALAVFAAEAQGELKVEFEDKFVCGVVDVGVGSPPTYYTLVLDTGTANTWVGANKAYIRTSASEETSDSVAVQYGGGSFSGIE